MALLPGINRPDLRQRGSGGDMGNESDSNMDRSIDEDDDSSHQEDGEFAIPYQISGLRAGQQCPHITLSSDEAELLELESSLLDRYAQEINAQENAVLIPDDDDETDADDEDCGDETSSPFEVRRFFPREVATPELLQTVADSFAAFVRILLVVPVPVAAPTLKDDTLTFSLPTRHHAEVGDNVDMWVNRISRWYNWKHVLCRYGVAREMKQVKFPLGVTIGKVFNKEHTDTEAILLEKPTDVGRWESLLGADFSVFSMVVQTANGKVVRSEKDFLKNTGTGRKKGNDCVAPGDSATNNGVERETAGRDDRVTFADFQLLCLRKQHEHLLWDIDRIEQERDDCFSASIREAVVADDGQNVSMDIEESSPGDSLPSMQVTLQDGQANVCMGIEETPRRDAGPSKQVALESPSPVTARTTATKDLVGNSKRSPTLAPTPVANVEAATIGQGPTDSQTDGLNSKHSTNVLPNPDVRPASTTQTENTSTAASVPTQACASSSSATIRNLVTRVDQNRAVSTAELPHDDSTSKTYMHFRSKLGFLKECSEYPNGVLSTVFATMWGNHKDSIGAQCSIDCKCVYKLTSLMNGVEKAVNEKQAQNGGAAYVPSGLMGTFHDRFMPRILEWYPDKSPLEHIHQLAPLWQFHTRNFGPMCTEGCRCTSAEESFRTVAFAPLTGRSPSICIYSRSHFDAKFNSLVSLDFPGKGQVVLRVFWELHQAMFGSLCHENCPCVNNLPSLVEPLRRRLAADPKFDTAILDKHGSCSTVFFNRFYSRLQAEYPSESPMSHLSRLVRMWEVHTNVYGHMCPPDCKCTEAWEVPFSKGNCGSTSVSCGRVPSSTSGQTSSKRKHYAIMPVEPQSDLEECDSEVTEVCTGDKIRKKSKSSNPTQQVFGPTTHSTQNSTIQEAQIVLQEDVTNHTISVEPPEKRAATPDAITHTDRLLGGCESAGFDFFRELYFPIVAPEYPDCAQEIVKIMWRKHTRTFGTRCTATCPCGLNISFLLANALPELKQDNRWASICCSDNASGFVGCFASKAVAKLRDSHPHLQPSDCLRLLPPLWERHHEVFGASCPSNCKCIDSWEQFHSALHNFVGENEGLSSERPPHQSEALCTEAMQGDEATSTQELANNEMTNKTATGSSFVESDSPVAQLPDKQAMETAAVANNHLGSKMPHVCTTDISSGTQRPPYDVTFDSRKPLGLYFVTEKKGRQETCKVISGLYHWIQGCAYCFLTAF